MTAHRFRYAELTPTQRTDVANWCRAHRLDPNHIPVDASLAFDSATNEWVIEQYATRDGKVYLGADGEVAKVKVRRLAVADPQMAWLGPA